MNLVRSKEKLRLPGLLEKQTDNQCTLEQMSVYQEEASKAGSEKASGAFTSSFLTFERQGMAIRWPNCRHIDPNDEHV